MLVIVEKYLKKNNYINNWNDFKENYYSHPNYPSLFALTDTLSLLGIENIAVQVPKDQLESLPNTFMAGIVLNKKKEIVLVKKENQNIYYETEDGEKHHIDFPLFRGLWDGLVIAVEENKQPVRITDPSNRIFYLFLAVISSVLLISFFSSDFGISLLLFKLISFIGLILSFFILQEKFAEGNGIVSGLCNLNTNTSCESVIKSDADLIRGVDFSDLPVLFFSTSFFAICLGQSYLPFIGFISLSAVPVIGYSIYLQSVKLEKWCMICLAVSTLILTQAVFFLFVFDSFRFDLENFSHYSLIVLIFSSIWYFFRNLLGERKNILDKNKDLFRFKRNFNLFKYLSKEVNEAEKLKDLQPINLGNKESPIELRLFLSPSCGHCHTAYKKAMDLMKKYPSKIKLQIYFNVNPENLSNPFVEVAKTILHLNQLSDEAKDALQDWHGKQIKLEEWLKKWKQQRIHDSVDLILKEQYQWCHQNDFNFTPVKLINNRLLPQEYHINELKYFLSDLLEEDKVELEVHR